MVVPMLGTLCSFERPAHAVTPVKTFAHISSDNRLKLWDVLSGKLRQQYTEPQHLSTQYTCLAFTGASESSKRKRGTTVLGIAAVGTENGHILLWNLQTGEVVHKLGGTGSDSSTAGAGHSGRVNDVVFNDQGTILYSCGDDRQIFEWNAQSGELISSFPVEKQAVKRLALSPDNTTLLSASTSIKLWDLSTKKALRRFAGHASEVTCLQFSPDGRYFLSASTDRYVNLWGAADDDSTTSKRKHRPALHTFAVDSRPVALLMNADTEDAESEASVYHVAVVTESSILSLWQWRPASEDDGEADVASTSPDAQIRVALPADKKTAAAERQLPPQKRGKRLAESESTIVPGSTAEGAIIKIHFVNKHQILIVRGSSVRPVFQQLTYVNEADGSFVGGLALAALTPAALAPEQAGEAKRREAGAGASTVSVTVAADARMTRPRSELDVKKSLDDAGSDTDGENRKRQKREMTKSLAERLAAILGPASVAASAAGATPAAGSLQTILTQALHSNDNELLEYCLQSGRQNEALIKRTVERLPTTYVLPFVTRMIDKFQGKPSRGLYLVPWIRETISTHTSYLVSVPDLASSLSTLYQTVDTRLAVFKKLLQLSGRLDLLIAQVNRRAAIAGTAAEGARDALNVYNEDEDEVPAEAKTPASKKAEDAEEEEEEVEEEIVVVTEEREEAPDSDDDEPMEAAAKRKASRKKSVKSSPAAKKPAKVDDSDASEEEEAAPRKTRAKSRKGKTK